MMMKPFALCIALLLAASHSAPAQESTIDGDFGDSSEWRGGFNYFPQRMRGIRVNGEWIQLNDNPVGYAAVPYPVGGNGDVYHLNFELNF